MDDRTDAPRRRRRFSIWTLLAPIALAAFVFVGYTAMSNTCLLDGGCAPASKDDDDKQASKAAKTKRTGGGIDPEALPVTATYKVKAGDNLSMIAERFALTESEVRACNPRIDPQSLQPGQRLFVSPKRCEGADLGEAGSDPTQGASSGSTG